MGCATSGGRLALFEQAIMISMSTITKENIFVFILILLARTDFSGKIP
jgi:hypothetical protein